MKTLTGIILIIVSFFSLHAQEPPSGGPPRRGQAETKEERARAAAEHKAMGLALAQIVHKPGNVFNDSQLLLQLMQSKKYIDIVVLLEYYFNSGEDVGDLMKKIEMNVYLSELLGPIKPELQKAIDDIKKSKEKIPIQPSGAKITGVSLGSLFPASKVADGLGSFIAERFKEELSQRYLEGFRDAIIKEEAKYHFSILLPQTYKALVSYENVFDYKAFLTTLKEAFKTDLDNLASNSLLFVDKIYTEDPALIKIDSETFYLFYYIADFIINKLPDGNSPSDFFKGVENYKYKEKLNPNTLGGFQIVNILERNLANSSENLEPARVLELVRNPDQLLAFSGLLIEGEKTALDGIKFSAKGTFQSGYALLNNKDIPHFIFGLKAVADLRQAAKSYRESEKKFKDVVDLALTVNPVIDSLLVKTEIVERTVSKKIAPIVNSTLKMAELADQEKYGLVIVESVQLLDSLNLQTTNFFKAYKKYGIFIANVAQAQSSQEVKEALEAAALPVGSYRIKRSSYFNISFNAFAGVTGGLEFRDEVPTELETDIDKVKPVLGFAAPVGLAFSWSKARNNSAASSSFFVSIVDIGAITSFRLGDDETETLPEFTWENILAPGAYYIYGFKNSPLSLGAGLQYGPQLRSIDDTTAELSHSMVTCKLMLVVDIPIFNFLTRTKD